MGFARFLSKIRKQTAVYWAPSETTGGNKVETFADPVELQVRWAGTTEQMYREEGTPFVPKFKVMVGQDVETGGFMWLGRLSELGYQEKKNPRLLNLAYRIEAFKSVPDIKNTATYRVAYL